MSASGTSTGERGAASGMAGVFTGAFWLAKREVFVFLACVAAGRLEKRNLTESGST